jgi:hypothetical protein
MFQTEYHVRTRHILGVKPDIISIRIAGEALILYAVFARNNLSCKGIVIVMGGQSTGLLP